jgi:hypothetical protein
MRLLWDPRQSPSINLGAFCSGGSFCQFDTYRQLKLLQSERLVSLKNLSFPHLFQTLQIFKRRICYHLLLSS